MNKAFTVNCEMVILTITITDIGSSNAQTESSYQMAHEKPRAVNYRITGVCQFVLFVCKTAFSSESG